MAILAAAVLAVLAFPLHAQTRPRRAAARVRAATLASFDTTLTSVPQSSIPYLEVLVDRLGRRIWQPVKDQYETTETWRRRWEDSLRTVADSTYAGWLRPGNWVFPNGDRIRNYSSPQLSYDPDREVYTVTSYAGPCMASTLTTWDRTSYPPQAHAFHLGLHGDCSHEPFEIPMPRGRAQELNGHWRFLVVIGRPGWRESHNNSECLGGDDFGSPEPTADLLALWAVDDRDGNVIAKTDLRQRGYEQPQILYRIYPSGDTVSIGTPQPRTRVRCGD